MTHPALYPPPPPRDRPPGATGVGISPWVLAVLIGGVTGVVIALVAGGSAYDSGAAFGATVLPTAAVALLVGLTPARAWPVWLVVLAVVAADLVGFAVVRGPDVLRERREAGQPSSTLAAPPVAGPWRRDDTAEGRAVLAKVRERLARSQPGTTLVGGRYRTTRGTSLVYLGFNAEPGTDVLATGQEDTLAGFVDSAKLDDVTTVDPGSMGGRISCGRNGATVLCGWADRDVFGTLIFEDPKLQVDEAGDQLLTFRSEVETSR